MLKEPRSEVVAGVTIVSRHGVEPELVRMRRAIEGLPEHLRSDVAELFADSKSGTFNIVLRSPENVEAIGAHFLRLRSTYIGFDFRGKRVLELRP